MAQRLVDVIAERTLEATDPGSGATREIRVRIGRPYADSDEDWICPVQILGIGNEEVATVYGVDAIQALTLALQKAGSDLSAVARGNLQVRWLEGSDLGFPLPHERPPPTPPK